MKKIVMASITSVAILSSAQAYQGNNPEAEHSIGLSHSSDIYIDTNMIGYMYENMNDKGITFRASLSLGSASHEYSTVTADITSVTVGVEYQPAEVGFLVGLARNGTNISAYGVDTTVGSTILTAGYDMGATELRANHQITDGAILINGYSVDSESISINSLTIEHDLNKHHAILGNISSDVTTIGYRYIF